MVKTIWYSSGSECRHPLEVSARRDTTRPREFTLHEREDGPAVAGPVEPTATPGALVLVHDDVSLRLDEVADLCEHWKRWREVRGQTPQAIRAALVVLARDVTMLADMEQQHGPRTEPIG